MYKNIFFQIVLTLIAYIASILIFKEYYFIVFALVILIIDKFLIKYKNTYVLYLLIPLLSIGLLFFDSESILRSARFILIFPILLVISKFIKKLSLELILSIVLIFATHFILQPNWASYYRNQINNESLNAKNLEDLKLDNLDFIKSDKDVYILDIWYSKCAVCYENMEILKSWTDENPQFRENIVLVNILLNGESFYKNENIVEKYGFKSTFTHLSFEEIKKLGVKTYPTQIVIKDEEIIFVGDLEIDKSVFINNIRHYLKK